MTHPFDQVDPEEKRSILDEHMLFCETGTLYALNLQRTTAAIIENADDNHSHEKFRIALNDALDVLLKHRATCPKCREEIPDAEPNSDVVQ